MSCLRGGATKLIAMTVSRVRFLVSADWKQLFYPAAHNMATGFPQAEQVAQGSRDGSHSLFVT